MHYRRVEQNWTSFWFEIRSDEMSIVVGERDVVCYKYRLKNFGAGFSNLKLKMKLKEMHILSGSNHSNINSLEVWNILVRKYHVNEHADNICKQFKLGNVKKVFKTCNSTGKREKTLKIKCKMQIFQKEVTTYRTYFTSLRSQSTKFTKNFQVPKPQ